MKYFTEKDKIIKSIAIGDQEIMVADNLFPTYEALHNFLGSGKKKWLDTALTFRYEAISRITLFDSDNCIQLRVNKEGKSEKVPIEFSTRADYVWLLELLEKKTGLTPSQASAQTSNGFAKTKNYLIVLAVALFSAALAGIAYEEEQGRHSHISGGKRGIKLLIAGLADTLGFYGSLALGLVVTLAVLYFMIRKNKSLSRRKTVGNNGQETPAT